MNNFEKQELIDKMTAKYTAKHLAGMLIDAQSFMDSLSNENQELDRKLDIAENIVLGDLNKIKAETVREAALHFSVNGLPNDNWSKSLEIYANQLEAKK